MPACQSLTKAGAPCRFPPQRDAGLCINHDRAYRDTQRLNVRHGAMASAKSRSGASVVLADFDLSTSQGIQQALGVVVRMELAGKLPIKRARDLLRAISLATREIREESPNRQEIREESSRSRLLQAAGQGFEQGREQGSQGPAQPRQQANP